MANRSEVINLSRLGDITLERSKIAKHIRMSIKPPSIIRVAVPLGVSFKEAHSFVISKESWLLNQIQRMSKSKINSLYFEVFRSFFLSILFYLFELLMPKRLAPYSHLKFFFGLQFHQLIVQ